jgi:hypothetical protein
MNGANFPLSGDELRSRAMKIKTIAAATKIWRRKKPKFFHCETLPRQTVSSAMLDL